MTELLYWDAGDADVRWGVSLTKSFEGNAAFTTHGLAAFGSSDLVIFTPSDALDHPEDYEGIFAILRAVVETLRSGEATTCDDHVLTLTAADPRAPKLRVSFVSQEYVWHDVFAGASGRAQTVGLVQLKIEEVST